MPVTCTILLYPTRMTMEGFTLSEITSLCNLFLVSTNSLAPIFPPWHCFLLFWPFWSMAMMKWWIYLLQWTWLSRQTFPGLLTFLKHQHSIWKASNLLGKCQQRGHIISRTGVNKATEAMVNTDNTDSVPALYMHNSFNPHKNHMK